MINKCKSKHHYYHQSKSIVPLNSRLQVTSFAAFSKPNLFRSLVWIKLKLENIRSIEAELAGRFSRRRAKSLNSGFTSLWLFLMHNHHTHGSIFSRKVWLNM